MTTPEGSNDVFKNFKLKLVIASGKRPVSLSVAVSVNSPKDGSAVADNRQPDPGGIKSW